MPDARGSGSKRGDRAAGALRAIAARLPTRVRRPVGRIVRSVLGPDVAARMAGSRSAWPSGASRAAVPPAPPRLQVRRDFVFRSADPAGATLEIGPAHNAILAKRDGYRTKTVDYLDRAGLVEKYRPFAHYSPDDIEEVDFVLPAGTAMSAMIHDRFDLVLASHVLEHTTSMIDFLNDCTRLLAPKGVLSLVVPDHRYCFDRFRERSSIGRVIDASINPPPVHTVGTLTEFRLNAVKHRGTTAWAAGHTGTYGFVHDLDDARKAAAEASGHTYVDVHNWVFSPNHLRLLLQDLHALDLIAVREVAFQDTIGHEFFLNLQVDGPGSGLSREELTVLASAEQTSLDVPVFEPAPATAPLDAPATDLAEHAR
jgi:SAM-dependent methyltransferase